MVFVFVLAMLMAASASAQVLPPSPLPSLEEATQMADAGRDAEALLAFQHRAAANPRDHTARMWIARLHERMGHPDLADPVYRSVMLEDPTNEAALVGVASILVDRGDADEALEILEAAADRAPKNASIQELIGRAHRLAGRDAQSIPYFERAVAIDPGVARQLRLESARQSVRHRVEIRGFNEQFDESTPDTNSGEVSLRFRVSDTVRILGRGQIQRKFGVSDQRGGGGIEWRWTPATTFRGHAIVGPDNVVMPEGDYLGELDHTTGTTTWSAGVRFFDFTGARTTVVTPAVSWAASDRLTLGARYAMSWTETNGFGSDLGQSVQIGADRRLRPRMWLLVSYAHGVEDYENFSIDRIGDFQANSIGGGVRFDLQSLTAILARYEYQWRSEDVNMGRVTVAIQQAF